MEQKKIDWTLRFVWLMVLIGAILVGSYYVTDRVNQCTSDPLGYAVKILQEKYKIDSVFGTVSIIANNGGYDTIEFGNYNNTNEDDSINWTTIKNTSIPLFN